MAGRFDGKDERTWNSSHLNGHFNEDNDENTLLLLAFEWQSQWISLMISLLTPVSRVMGFHRLVKGASILPFFANLAQDLS